MGVRRWNSQSMLRFCVVLLISHTVADGSGTWCSFSCWIPQKRSFLMLLLLWLSVLLPVLLMWRYLTTHCSMWNNGKPVWGLSFTRLSCFGCLDTSCLSCACPREEPHPNHVLWSSISWNFILESKLHPTVQAGWRAFCHVKVNVSFVKTIWLQSPLFN